MSTIRNFVGLDGESIDDKYVLLGTSLSNKCLENRQGIRSIEALDWLYHLGRMNDRKNRHQTFVGFHFSYDVEMLMRDLPTRTKLLLFHAQKTEYKGYYLHYCKRKFLRIRYHKCKGITIYDTCG